MYQWVETERSEERDLPNGDKEVTKTYSYGRYIIWYPVGAYHGAILRLSWGEHRIHSEARNARCTMGNAIRGRTMRHAMQGALWGTQ